MGNSYAKGRVEYISNQKSLSEKYKYQPIRAQFPIKESFDIYTSYIYIGDDTRGLPKYIVLNIHSDNAPLGFEELHYKQFSETSDPRNIAPQLYAIPKKPNKKFKRKKPQRDNKVYAGTPSNEYLTYVIHSNEDEHFKNKLSVYGKTVYLDDDSKLKIEKTSKQIGSSFEKPSANGDEDLGCIAESTDSDETKKEPNEVFNLENFYQFYEALLTFAYVEGSELIGPLEINKIQNKKRNSYKAQSIRDGDENKARRFLFGELSYDQKAVYIVEIEQDSSWGPSTWIFYTSEDAEQYVATDMREIIEYYIASDKISYAVLAQYVLEKYSLIFDYQEHKKGDVDDDSIERWCEGVLKKIF